MQSHNQILLDRSDMPAAAIVARDAQPSRIACERIALDDAPSLAWAALHARAAEPNAFYDPLWAGAVAAHARDAGDVSLLMAWDNNAKQRLIGLQPVRSAWREMKLPLPLLVAWRAYAPLSVPLLDKDASVAAFFGLVTAARTTGARALLIPRMTVSGPAFAALTEALAAMGVEPRLLNRHERASLDATQDADAALQTLGSKKLKELRRQRNRLSDAGDISLDIATSPSAVADALEAFLALEDAGWKGTRGTALARHAGDALFIRQAAATLAAQGHFEIVSLKRNNETLAAGLVLRHHGQAFFFKMAYDETESKTSPGVQLTLDLTRHLCDDVKVQFVDSTADANHPMIDHVWRERIAIADVFVPLKAGDPVASLIHTLITTRQTMRDAAQPLVRFARKIREKRI